MRITTKHTPLPDQPEAHITLRARIDQHEPGPPVFVIEIQGQDGKWIPTRIIDGERIEFTVYLP